jgi:hypothetical protein
VCHGLDNGRGTPGRIAALEDTRTDEHPVHAQLHHQRRIRRGRDTTRREIDDRHASEFFCLFDEFIRRADFFGICHELFVGHGR